MTPVIQDALAVQRPRDSPRELGLTGNLSKTLPANNQYHRVHVPFPWAGPMSRSGASWPSSGTSPSDNPQGSRHHTSAAHGDRIEVPFLHSPRWPPMSRMQLFSAKAELELQRLANAEAEWAALGGPDDADRRALPVTDEPELQEALSLLVRAETASDFARAVSDAEAAARTARPRDAEHVASLAAAESVRRRAAKRAAALQAHITDVIQEPLPAQEGGQRGLEVIGYVGMTGTGTGDECDQGLE